MLMTFVACYRVVKQSNINQMTAYNLAVVFTPTLMRSETTQPTMVGVQAKLIEYFITKK